MGTKTKATKRKAPAKKAKPAAKGRGRGGAKQIPLMEGIRYDDLDAFCEAIGDARDRQARALADENAEHEGAQDALTKHGLTVYKHAGLELALIPGRPTLRVRKVKDKKQKAEVAE